MIKDRKLLDEAREHLKFNVEKMSNRIFILGTIGPKFGRDN